MHSPAAVGCFVLVVCSLPLVALGEMTIPLLFARGAPGEDFKVLCEVPEKEKQVPCMNQVTGRRKLDKPCES